MPDEPCSAVIDRRYSPSWCDDTRGLSGPAVLPLFCLAPHGVFPASRITPRAVSSYLAFSPLPELRMPKNRRCIFCDTLRRRNLSIAAPACSTRHAAVWCSDFPPANLAIHQRSSAIDQYCNIDWATRVPILGSAGASPKLGKAPPRRGRRGQHARRVRSTDTQPHGVTNNAICWFVFSSS
jgi:hypothetical protein